MSLSRCIPELAESGRITPEQAKRAAALFEDMAGELRRSMAPDAAEALASSRAVEAIEFEAKRKRANALRQIDAQRRTEQWLRGGGERWGRGAKGGGPDGPDGPLPGEGPSGPINPKAARTLIAMMDARRRAIRSDALRHMDEVLERHRLTVTGKLRNRAELDELGRAAFGEELSSPGALAAKEGAEAWHSATEGLRLRANAAGANIGKLENRGFGTHHGSRAVADAGFDAWWAAERPRWGLDRMVDEETGQPFTAARIDAAARAVHETIASDGASKRLPGAVSQLSYANRLGQHRFIHYKSYDDWAASQAQFGVGTAFDAMMGEIDGMSRAIAAMEVLGPNPEAGMRFLEDLIAGDPDLFKPGQIRRRNSAEAGAARARRLWEEYTGALRRPEHRSIALAGSTYRAVAAGARLGTAFVSALSDLAYGAATRRFNALPVSGMIGDYVRLFNPADVEQKKLLTRLGFALDTWTSTVTTQSRFLFEEYSYEWARRLTDGVLRITGLNGITDAGRGAFGKLLLGHVTDQRGKAWAELEPGLRASMRRYRIGAGEWEAIRGTSLEEDGGLEWIAPWNVEDRGLGDRLWEWSHNEMDYAVPVPTLEVRAWLDTHARPGTWWGEFARSSPLLFKTFTLAVIFRHGARMAEQQGIMGKAGYFAAVAVPATVIGALSEQIYSLLKMQDPRPMDPRSEQGRMLWMRALGRGGGASILGDLAGLTAEERYMGWAGYFAGPLVTDAGELADAVGEERGAWRAARVGRQYVPGQNIWYSRWATDRLLADQVQSMIDPDYLNAWRRMQRRAEAQGSGFWWEPGETAPERTPDLSTALEAVPG